MISLKPSISSVEDTTLISWDHVLDIDESIFSSLSFESLKGSLDKVTQILSLSLRVVNLVAQVLVACLK